MEKTTQEIVNMQIQRTLSRKQVPVRLAVYDEISGNFLGYKGDSGWGLDKERIKVHPLSDSRKKGKLAKNLLYFCNEKDSEGGENFWINKFPQGVRVVVEDITDLQNPKKALEYQIIKQENKYILN